MRAAATPTRGRNSQNSTRVGTADRGGMMMYSVTVINGNYLDAADIETETLHYDGLSFDEAVELCRLSFSQGYECVIWRGDKE